MSILDTPLTDVPFEQLVAHIQELKVYLSNTTDPNEVAANGQTCVSIALQFCNTDDGVQLLKSLLDKGGNPNLPSSIYNFSVYTTASTSLLPLQYMVDAGLEVNNVYGPTPGIFEDGDRHFTLLDYVLDIHAYLNKNRKSLDSLANKYAGGLGPRRKFIDETISFLTDHGARRAEELA